MRNLLSLLVLSALICLARSQICYDWDNAGHTNCVVAGCSTSAYSITNLDLGNKGLMTLSTCIGTMTNLQTLVLDDNQLTSLPREIGDLTKLNYLFAVNNQLTSLPTEIGKLTSLLGLHVYKNQLTSLLTEIGKLTSLTVLNVNGNELTSLPTEIGKLTKLQLLYVHENQLTSLPTEIGKLTSLDNLYVYGNKLTSLPTEIGKLTSLNNLYVDNNRLTSLPTEIGGLTSLNVLLVNSNQLTSLPTEIGKLTTLQLLWISSNQLTSLPTEIGKLTSLNVLWISSNQLTSIPTDIGKLTNLFEFVYNQNPYNCPVDTTPRDSSFYNNAITDISSRCNFLCPTGKCSSFTSQCQLLKNWGGSQCVPSFCDSNPCTVPFSFCENGQSNHICNCLPGYEGDGDVECTPNTRTTSLSSLQPLARFTFDGTNEDSTGTGTVASLTPGITRGLFYQRGNPESEALRLYGNDLITFPLTTSTKLTVEVIFNVQQLTPLYDLFTILPTPTSPRSQAKMIIAGDANQKLHWYGSNLVRIGISRKIIRVGITHSLVSTVRGGKIVTFLDNIKLGTFDLTLTGGTHTLVIGNNFNGLIDEVSVFNVGIFDPPGNTINDLTECNNSCSPGQVCANNPTTFGCVAA